MPQIAVDSLGLSNLVKRQHPWMESDGYGLEIATTAAATGQVMKKTAGVWAAITTVPLATDTIGVVLDATKEDSTKKRILLVAKGEAILSDAALVYFSGATAQNKLDTIALLESGRVQVNKAV